MEDWKEIDQALRRLAKDGAAHEYELGRWLLAAVREEVDRHLGYGSLLEYAERVFGFSPRATSERLRVARSLEQLPEMAAALAEGTLSYSAVRELTRVAIADTEAEWIAAADGKTVRQLERMVSGRARGKRPTDDADEEAKRRVVRFDVKADTYALLREAQRKLTADSGGHLSDDEVVELLARAVLGGPTDQGRASYQVHITKCESCDKSKQKAGPDMVVIDAAAAEAVACDAQVVGDAHVGPVRATQGIPPATRRQMMLRDEGRCKVPGCRNSCFVDVHHVIPRADGGTHDPDLLCVLCSVHHDRVHEGRLLIEGTASTGFSFLHADGTSYGRAVVAPVKAGVFADAFAGLRHMGFRETEARRALDKVRAHVGRDAGLETVIREALLIMDSGQTARCRDNGVMYGCVAALPPPPAVGAERAQDAVRVRRGEPGRGGVLRPQFRSARG